jgi:hypothetical protein
MVADIFSSRSLKVSFRRNLVTDNLHAWHNLVTILMDIHSTYQSDIFKWSLNWNGQFSVSSRYQAYLDRNIVPKNTYLWKIKLSLKIKVFLWLLYKEAILTKDNLAKRNWHGNERCCFCNNFEIVQHLFFDCALAKFIWRVVDLFFRFGAPNNIKNMFGSWVQNMNAKNKRLFYVGIGDMLWSIWLSRNDIIFNKTPISSYM